MGIYLGLISGTSMDAIDAALVDFDVAPLRIIATSATAFDPTLKRRISALIDRADRVALDEVGQIDVELGRAFAQASLALMKSAGIGANRVTAIGSHGQTLRHRPDLPAPFTWQIGDPNTLAEMTGISVVADFRRRDVAAGGQGAPLLPVFHDQVFRSDSEDRVIANLGGIANITILTHDSSVTGFDTGPGQPPARCLDRATSGQGLRCRRRLGRHPARSTRRCCANCWTNRTLRLAAAQEHRARAVQPAVAAKQAGLVLAAAARCAGDAAAVHRRARSPPRCANTRPERRCMFAAAARTMRDCSMPSRR